MEKVKKLKLNSDVLRQLTTEESHLVVGGATSAPTECRDTGCATNCPCTLSDLCGTSGQACTYTCVCDTQSACETGFTCPC